MIICLIVKSTVHRYSAAQHLAEIVCVLAPPLQDSLRQTEDSTKDCDKSCQYLYALVTNVQEADITVSVD